MVIDSKRAVDVEESLFDDSKEKPQQLLSPRSSKRDRESKRVDQPNADFLVQRTLKSLIIKFGSLFD